MRVALLSYNAQIHSAVGNQIAERLAFFAERGDEARLFVQSCERLHPQVADRAHVVAQPRASGPAWDYLTSCDLVLVVFARPFALTQLLPLLAGGDGPRVVFLYQGVEPPQGGAPATRREPLEQGIRQRGLVWCADHALADSHFLAQELQRGTDFPQEHIAALPLAVAPAFAVAPSSGADRSADRDFLRRTLKLDADAQIVLFVGRLTAGKRVPLLVEAVALLRDRRPATHAVIVGDDSEPAGRVEAGACRALAQRLHVADRVHLVGQLDDDELASACRGADALATASLHEGFGAPVLEAMACGLPVVASRSAALPETVGDAALTFLPNDAVDLARQLRRVLDSAALPDHAAATRPRVAFVCYRFGPEVLGGAEASLRVMAKTLQQAGCSVEVFTTCTLSESDWRNEVNAGTILFDGLAVHRFPIASHRASDHADSLRRIVEKNGQATPDEEQAFLRHSVHSPALMDALRQRRDDFDAIVAGPYQIGLTHDVARAFPARTLLAPCFHDEPTARLRLWPALCDQLGGILYHSPEEQHFAQAVLGVNHPNSCEVGAWVKVADAASATTRPGADARPYLAYCGRYTRQKNVPLLLEWLSRYQSERSGRFDVVFLGQGEVPIPCEPWLRSLGRVDEAQRNAVLAGAKALLQLSHQESLSLVALEAWAQRTPVVVHQGCTVLAAQVRRADGGASVSDYETFARALDDLWQRPDEWRARGLRGHAYVAQRYASFDAYRDRLLRAATNLRRPIAALMRERGVERAQLFSRRRWRERFAAWLDRTTALPRRPFRDDLGLQPLHACTRVTWGTRTVLLPVRLFNWGSHAVLAEGPGATILHAEVSDLRSGQVIACALPAPLAELLLPGKSLTTVLSVPVPELPGQYRVSVWTERPGSAVKVPFRQYLSLSVETQGTLISQPGCTSTFLQAIQQALPEAKRLQSLPVDYLDHTEGFLGRLKQLIKRKLINGFKSCYVDVLSRQQTHVNEQLVHVVHQLSECCTTLDLAVRGLQRRIDQLETKLDDAVLPQDHDTVDSTPVMEDAA